MTGDGHATEGQPIAKNAYVLLWAGFMAILAAGVGFAIRGGILDNWGREYGFTGGELGAIGGSGFTGFCFGIILGGIVADKIGYGKLVIAAFLFHIASAFVTFGATTGGLTKDQIYNFLYWGTFLFAIANGTLEAVANPLVATLFPHNRTHYLNILHASWPAGLILGGVLGWVLDDQLKWPWVYQLALFLIPTVLYGIMFLGQKMPRSEASEKGISLGSMFKDVGILGGLVVCGLLALFFGNVVFDPLFKAVPQLNGLAPYSAYAGYGVGAFLLLMICLITNFSIGSFLLFVLFVTHALVGAVELGTDGWIQNITGNLLSSEQGKILFVFTSAVMFSLRFCAHYIEKNIGLSPVGLLFVCAVTACVGLNLTSQVNTFAMAMVALTIYGIGKTFFWPTMLAVASDRFPQTGAVAISIMGGIGMMSAGLLGSSGLGYSKDYYSAESLKTADAALYEKSKSATESKFLFLPAVNGIDGKVLGDANDAFNKLKEKNANATTKDLENKEHATLIETSIQGDRKTLVADSFIPGTMAIIYLILVIYFMSIGGYKPLHITSQKEEIENS